VEDREKADRENEKLVATAISIPRSYVAVTVGERRETRVLGFQQGIVI